jgi:aerobic-type carbon monoxide dehydrogenase small subunit (CoxS/CutS family)
MTVQTVDRVEIALRVNQVSRTLELPAETTLLEALNDHLGLHGARGACGIGVCGACTVLVDGRAMSSCLLLAAQAAGRDIVTIEGLATETELHPVQQAFIDHEAFQCAYCTPGFILTTVALLREEPEADEQAVREYLSGNLCRCGSYVNILEAVRALRGQPGPAAGQAR